MGPFGAFSCFSCRLSLGGLVGHALHRVPGCRDARVLLSPFIWSMPKLMQPGAERVSPSSAGMKNKGIKTWAEWEKPSKTREISLVLWRSARAGADPTRTVSSQPHQCPSN